MKNNVCSILINLKNNKVRIETIDKGISKNLPMVLITWGSTPNSSAVYNFEFSKLIKKLPHNSIFKVVFMKAQSFLNSTIEIKNIFSK
jgi:hypothetical protein